jgi:hypothetical protein
MSPKVTTTLKQTPLRPPLFPSAAAMADGTENDFRPDGINAVCH